MKYRIIILVGVGVIILIAIFALLFGRKSEDRFGGALQVWSFEEEAVWRDITAAFESQNPKVEVQYVQKNPATYEEDLLNALAAGRGPDIFALHQTWMDKHFDKLAPLGEKSMSLSQFRGTFVDVAAKDLVRGENIYALPLYIDTLALYYNRDIFNSSGIVAPPVTWEEFIETVGRVVQRSETGEILLAGAALGTSPNVEHAPDILAALMLQSGVRMIDDRGRAAFNRSASVGGESFNPGEAALAFYTDFANPEKAAYTWSRRLPGSLEAFRSGQAAMYLGYAADLGRLENTSVSFAIAPFPQIIDRRQDPAYLDLNYANYWALGLSRVSRNPEAAREFLLLASSRNAVFSFLSKAGLPTARRDLINIQTQDDFLAPFARQTLTADSWRAPDFKATRGIFSAMIEDVTLGRASVEEALEAGVAGINNLLGR